MSDETNLVKALLSEKVVEDVYEDVMSGAAKEIGGLGTDLVKTARLLLAPIQFAAAYQDRLRRVIERIANKVPDGQRVEPPPEVVGPAIERMKYVSEDSPLWEMFEELLTKSIDRDRVGTIHPSFTLIISQLARDEAVILALLGKGDFEITDYLDYNSTVNRFENRKIEKSNLPTSDLYLPEQLDLYYSHLESLNLVAWPVYKQDPVKNRSDIQIGIRRCSRMHLTDFGKLFVSACVPVTGFVKLNEN
jgi:hypothetical protein